MAAWLSSKRHNGTSHSVSSVGICTPTRAAFELLGRWVPFGELAKHHLPQIHHVEGLPEAGGHRHVSLSHVLVDTRPCFSLSVMIGKKVVGPATRQHPGGALGITFISGKVVVTEKYEL